jgi:hypothetical protein
MLLLLQNACASESGDPPADDTQDLATADLNDDGVVDNLGEAVDPQHDGIIDEFDFHGDGSVMGPGIDTNDDGSADAIGFDQDDDGLIDALDTDGDGEPDCFASDEMTEMACGQGAG